MPRTIRPRRFRRGSGLKAPRDAGPHPDRPSRVRHPGPRVPDRGSPPWRASHAYATPQRDAHTTAHADAITIGHGDADTDSHMDADTDMHRRRQRRDLSTWPRSSSPAHAISDYLHSRKLRAVAPRLFVVNHSPGYNVSRMSIHCYLTRQYMPHQRQRARCRSPTKGWCMSILPSPGKFYRFNPPPNWPPPPPGWTPPHGWAPDPSWPPPPYGWQLWLEAAPAVGTEQGIGAGVAAGRSRGATVLPKSRSTAMWAYLSVIIMYACLVLLSVIARSWPSWRSSTGRRRSCSAP